MLRSGCSGIQNDSAIEKLIPPGSETMQAANSSFATDINSDAENSAAGNEFVSNKTDISSSNGEESNTPVSQPNDNSAAEENTMGKMTLQIGNSSFIATLESNTAVDALVDMMRETPVMIQMSDYSGFEKVGSLGISLPISNSPTITKSGDIVLYNGNQIVIFYGSNSWSYTRLGRIDDLSGWEDALGSGDVTVIFSLK